MQARFQCDTTHDKFIQVLRREARMDFDRNRYGPREFPADGVRYYVPARIPKVEKNGTGGYLIKYQIESHEIHPQLKEFTDEFGTKYALDVSKKEEGSTTFNVQPVGSRIDILAECGHEMVQEHFEELLALIGKLFPESNLANRKATEATFPRTSNQGAPWDKLATKSRWNDEDWIYLFTHLLPDSDAANVTPDFAKIEQKIEEICITRKDRRYIKKKYYGVYYRPGKR